MKFEIDNDYNKIIIIPLVYADSIAKQFKHLQGERIFDFAENDELYDIQVHYEAYLPIGIIVIYKELTKPNVLFKFSKPVSDQLMEGDDLDYWMRCNFFYWEDNGIGRIRIATPLNVVSNESLLGNE